MISWKGWPAGIEIETPKRTKRLTIQGFLALDSEWSLVGFLLWDIFWT
jgi:hypothetical protein